MSDSLDAEPFEPEPLGPDIYDEPRHGRLRRWGAPLFRRGARGWVGVAEAQGELDLAERSVASLTRSR